MLVLFIPIYYSKIKFAKKLNYQTYIFSLTLLHYDGEKASFLMMYFFL